MADVFAKIWKWLLLAAAVVGGLALPYFAGGSRSRDEQDAAVDAVKSADAVKAAQDQADAAQKKAAEIAAGAATKSQAIAAERQALATGQVDTSAIDRQLREAGILK